MAKKEIYRLEIKVGVTGDGEAKSKLSAAEKIAEKTKKKMKALDKMKASPSAKLKDQASSKLDKLESKVNKFKSASMTLTAKLKDGASSGINKIEGKTKKIKEANVKIKAKDEASNIISKIENKINGWVKAGAKKVISIGLAGAVALGGIGVGSSVKTFANFEKGLSNVKAVTGATNAEMQTLKDTAKGLGASTAWSAVQVTQAEELLGQAGFGVQETISALPGLLSLASAGDLDLAAATDIASGTLRAFNISADKTGHVADVLALSASATNSDVADLGETMKYCAPVSQALGISLEDTASAAGLLSNANIKGSQAGTVLRASLARLASPTKESSELMKKYGINAFDAQGKMKPLSDVVDNLNGSLGKLTSQQRADVIASIFGVEAMSGVLALMNQGGQGLGDLSRKLKDSNGAAKDMADTKLDNLTGQWIILKSAVEGAQIELGERLAPYAKQFVTWLTNKMPDITNGIVKFVDYISKNTTTVKALATSVIGLGVAFTGLSAAGKVGNIISGISGLSKTLKGAKVAKETTEIAGGLKSIGLIGKILPALLSPVGLAIAGTALVAGTAFVANANLMKKSVSTTTEELGPMEKIMNKLNGSVIKSKAEMQGLGLIYEDFGQNIGNDFKKKVEDSTKSIREFQFFINKINLDGKIDESESSQFDSKINEMCNNAIKTIESKKGETQSALSALFADDGTISEAEQVTLDYFSKKYESQVTAEQKLKDEIYNIKKKAVEEHGKLLDEDIAQVKAKQEEMARIELEAVGGTIDEQNYAKNKFKARAEGVNIKDASQLLKDSAKERDNAIVEIKAKYNTYIDKLKTALDDDLKLSDNNPNKLKADERTKMQSSLSGLEKARADKIKARNDLYDENLDTLYKQNPNLKGKLNRYTGEELTDGDIRSQNRLEKMKSQYSDLKNITKDGFYGVRDSVTGAMNSMYVTVDKTTGEITGAWDYTTRQAGGYTDEMKRKVEELGSSNLSAGAAIQTLADTQARVNTTNGEVTTSYGEVIGKLQDVSIAADGTRTAILNIGDKYIQITSNADGQITSMQEFKGSVDSIPPSADVSISSNANEAKGEVNGLLGSLGALGSKIWTATVSITEKIFGSGNNPDQRASGTNYFKGGFSTVNERGWELADKKTVSVVGQYRGNPLTYMPKGTKILNHMESVRDMQKEVSRQVDSKIAKQPFQQQIQYQVVQPQQQVQVAGMGGLSFGDININVDGNQDIDPIIAEAMQDFGIKLKEALTNIKK